MAYQAKNSNMKTPLFFGLVLILAVLLAMWGGIVSVSRPLNASAPNSAHGAVDSESPELTNRKVSEDGFVAANGDLDWPQVQRDPQRTGYTPEILGTSFQVTWTHPFQPEKVYPQVQAIIYSGKVFVGTEMGNMYALNAQTGDVEWVYHVGAPILASTAAYDNKVFFGAMDGAIYALHVDDGSLAWPPQQLSDRVGFSTAPVVAEGKIMLGGRNGIFYALDPDTGTVLWQHNIGAPILQTAAWNDGKVYFGAMDMHAYALYTDTGIPDGSRRAWQSAKIPGMALKDYWPVVYQDMVYIRPMGMGSLGVQDPSMVTDPVAQQAVLADYEANPGNYEITMRRFYESTGQEAPAVIHYNFQTMNGATSPPCVDRDGYLAIPALYPESGSYETGWGRLNVNSRIIVDILNDGTDAGYGNSDENMNLTCTGNLILAMHTEEMNAQFTGAFDLDSWTWTDIPVGHTNRQMSTNTQGGGGSPASVSDGIIYHISFHELIARVAQN